MQIGIPRERKTLEKRVALTPSGAKELIAHGHKVTIETGAGNGSHFSDAEYQSAGCQIADKLVHIWEKSDLVVKVKEPHEVEYPFFRPGLAVFAFLHLAGLPELTQALLRGGITGIAYELVQTPEKQLPLLEPMSEVAGKLAVQNGAYFLQSQNAGRGVLLGGTSTVAPAKVVIIGAGVAGRAACQVAAGMGASVVVFDINPSRLVALPSEFGPRVRGQQSTPEAIRKELKDTDLLIGAILVPGAAAPRVLTRAMIAALPKGAVFVDISVDQGGCAETTQVTSLQNPVYEVEGVLHYGVPNIPAQTPRTSTLALTNVTLPRIISLAERGIDECLRSNAELRSALNTYQGLLTNQAVAQAVGLSYTSIDKALGQP